MIKKQKNIKKTKQNKKMYPRYLGWLVCILFADKCGLQLRTRKGQTTSGKLRVNSQLGLKKVTSEL